MQVRGFPTRDETKGKLPPEWTPASLAEAESRFLMMLGKYSTDPKTLDACGKLKGWSIYPMPTPSFVDAYGRKVAGWTNCQLNFSVAGAGYPAKWALPHELVHALQRCEATGPVDPGQDDYHANWVRDGLRRVVDYMETWVDETPLKAVEGHLQVGPFLRHDLVDHSNEPIPAMPTGDGQSLKHE